MDAAYELFFKENVGNTNKILSWPLEFSKTTSKVVADHFLCLCPEFIIDLLLISERIKKANLADITNVYYILSGFYQRFYEKQHPVFFKVLFS